MLAFREANEELKFLDEAHTIKMVDIFWNRSSDKITATVAHLSSNFGRKALTKRQVLSETAKIFDPMGWLSPITLQLKHLMQQVLQCQINWNQQLPSELMKAYLDRRRKLEALKNIQIPRFCLSKEQKDKMTLHVFCDASEKEYAACIYVVAEDTDGMKTSKLLAARLEVCGALWDNACSVQSYKLYQR